MLPCRSDMRGAGMEFRAGAFAFLGLFPLWSLAFLGSFACLGLLAFLGALSSSGRVSCSISTKIVPGTNSCAQKGAPAARSVTPCGGAGRSGNGWFADGG